MARTITLYRVFLASPSDLKDERSIVEDIIDELNLSYYNNSDIKVELVRWETHVNSGIGEYPQQVINNDTGDYDIFIGLLWSRFGQPTNSYGSGTEEEFYNAYEKYKRDNTSIKIMFYFKQAAIPFDKIDTDSINLIRKFKNDLGEKGVLYWEYNEIDEFQKLIRLQLTRKISELKHITQQAITPQIIKSDIKINLNQVDENEDELGIIDYLEIGEECFKNIEEILLRMTDAIEWVGNRFTERTAEVNKQTLLNPQMSNNTKKRLVNAAADDMYSFVKRLGVEIPIFSQTFRKGIDSMSNAVEIGTEFQADSIEDIDSAIIAIDNFINVMKESNEKCEEFKDSVDNLPRMTKEFNHAKRATSKVLMDLIDEIYIAINLSEAVRNDFINYKQNKY